VAPSGEARKAGQQAVGKVRRQMAKGLAGILRKDPDRLAAAIDMGLVSRAWLDNPGTEPITAATPTAIIERYLERTVEQRPSMLAALGLSAIQILSWGGESEPGEGGATQRLAVVFTDLEGFTAFTADEGDEAASRLLGEHHRVTGPIVRSRGGRVVKRLGDGLLVTFPEPEAAVLACLELAEDPPAPLSLRAGVHLGDVVVTRDDVLGHTVNVAARVTESAKGGEVLATAAVCDAAGELRGVEFGRSRKRKFRGLPDDVPVCVVRRSKAP
jgi:adenylate cyclase